MLYISTYLTKSPDPQRGIKWTPNPKDVLTLFNSIPRHAFFVLLVDEDFDENFFCKTRAKFLVVKVSPIINNPYLDRWIHIREYLNSLKYYKEANYPVCILDATDTQVLNQEPRDSLIKDNTIYIGHEQEIVGSEWMLKQYYEQPYYKDFLDEYAKRQLLNGGVLAGRINFIEEFLTKFVETFLNIPEYSIDMGILNMFAYTNYEDCIEYGNHITTQFKKEETNKISWIKHK